MIHVYGLNDSPYAMERRYDPRFWTQFIPQLALVSVRYNIDKERDLQCDSDYDALMKLFISISKNN